MKDLTNSAIDRQNILNNKKAVENIQNFLGNLSSQLNRSWQFFKEEHSGRNFQLLVFATFNFIISFTKSAKSLN